MQRDAPRRDEDSPYERFLRALFERRLEPGSFVSQSDLVRILDVPVAPLRDALRVLQAEGLLTIHPRSGIELRRPDLSLVRNTYQMRMILERPAVRLLAEVASSAQLEQWSEAHRAAIERLRGRDLGPSEIPDVEAFDQDFHLQLIAALDNPLIEAAYAQAQRFIRLIRLDRQFRYSATVAIRTFTEHLAVLDAMRSRDAAAAEAALNEHFTRAMQRAMGFF